MNKITTYLARNLKNLFLIDSLGALLTTLFLIVLLQIPEHYMGMPKNVLTYLSILSVCFCIYSASCYLFLKNNRSEERRVGKDHKLQLTNKIWNNVFFNRSNNYLLHKLCRTQYSKKIKQLDQLACKELKHKNTCAQLFINSLIRSLFIIYNCAANLIYLLQQTFQILLRIKSHSAIVKIFSAPLVSIVFVSAYMFLK